MAFAVLAVLLRLPHITALLPLYVPDIPAERLL